MNDSFASFISEAEEEGAAWNPADFDTPDNTPDNKFLNSPIRGIKQPELRDHFRKKVDERGDDFEKHIDFDGFIEDQRKEAETDEHEGLEYEWGNFGAAARADLRPAPPKNIQNDDRKNWEKEKKEWGKKWYGHNKNMSVDNSYGKVNPKLGNKLHDMKWRHEMDDPKWFNYTGAGYAAVNHYLRHGIKDDDSWDIFEELSPNSGGQGWSDRGYGLEEHPELLEAFLSEHLGAMMDDLGDLPSVNRFRKLEGRNPFENLQEGQIITDPGFMSTSYDRDFVENDFGRKDDGVIMDIFGKPLGRDIDFYNSPHPFDESESILAPNTEMKFLGRDNESGHYKFDILGNNREGMNEETQQQRLKLSKKRNKKSTFANRMNDFQFEIVQPKRIEHDD